MAFLPCPEQENVDFITSEFINNNAFTKDCRDGINNIHLHFYTRKMSVIENESYDPYLIREPTSINSLTAGDYQINL